MTYTIATAVLDEQPTVAKRAVLRVQEIPAWIGRTYHAVVAHLERVGGGPAGMPYARYHTRADGAFDVEAGFVTRAPVAGQGDVVASTLPAGEVATTVHIGPYDGLGAAYDAIASWAAEHGAVLADDMWEVYHSDPLSVPDPAEWRTDVVWPIHR